MFCRGSSLCTKLSCLCAKVQPLLFSASRHFMPCHSSQITTRLTTTVIIMIVITMFLCVYKYAASAAAAISVPPTHHNSAEWGKLTKKAPEFGLWGVRCSRTAHVLRGEVLYMYYFVIPFFISSSSSSLGAAGLWLYYCPFSVLINKTRAQDKVSMDGALQPWP